MKVAPVSVFRTFETTLAHGPSYTFDLSSPFESLDKSIPGSYLIPK